MPFLGRGLRHMTAAFARYGRRSGRGLRKSVWRCSHLLVSASTTSGRDDVPFCSFSKHDGWTTPMGDFHAPIQRDLHFNAHFIYAAIFGQKHLPFQKQRSKIQHCVSAETRYRQNWQAHCLVEFNHGNVDLTLIRRSPLWNKELQRFRLIKRSRWSKVTAAVKGFEIADDLVNSKMLLRKKSPNATKSSSGYLGWRYRQGSETTEDTKFGN